MLGAFKELQTTARGVERGRGEALRQRDELRRLLAESRRHQALSRSKNESMSNEPIVAVRKSCENVKASQQEVHGRMYAREAEMRVLQEDLETKTRRLCELEQELADEHCAQIRLARRTRELESQLEQTEKRHSVMQARHQSLTVSAAETKIRALDEVSACKVEAQQTRDAASRAQMRAGAMSEYISMVLGVNADLVRSLEQQSAAAAQLERFVILPRYSWPKGTVRGALQLVATAATDSLYQAQGGVAAAAFAQAQAQAQGRRGQGLGKRRKALSSTPLGAGRQVTLISSPTPALARSFSASSKRRATKTPSSNSTASPRPQSAGLFEHEHVVDEQGALSAADFLNALVRNSRLQQRQNSTRRRRQAPINLPSYMRPKSF